MYVTIEWTRLSLHLFFVGSRPLITSTCEMGRWRVGKCGGCAFRSAPQEGEVGEGVFTLRLCKFVWVFARSPPDQSMIDTTVHSSPHRRSCLDDRHHSPSVK